MNLDELVKAIILANDKYWEDNTAKIRKLIYDWLQKHFLAAYGGRIWFSFPNEDIKELQ